MNIRQIILDELSRRGWTRYRLASAVSDHMDTASVYRFLNGKNDMICRKVEKLLEALDMEVNTPPGRRSP